MKAEAIITLTNMVTRSGKRLERLSFHNARNSSEWFFFITMALRNGAIMDTVTSPQMPLAHQCMPGMMLRTKGRKNMNITAMEAEERIE